MKSLFYNLNFRHLFLARTSAILAQSILLIISIKWIELNTEQDIWIYILFIVLNLPGTLFSIPFSTFVENKILQKIMRNVEIGRIISWSLFILSYNIVGLWGLLLFVFVDKTLLAFYIPANQSLLPHIVKKEELPIANSFHEFAFVSMRILGMIVTALLIKIGFSIIHILFIGVFCLLISVFYINKIKPFIQNKDTNKKRLLGNLLEGFVYIKGKFDILFLLSVFGVLWMVDSVSDIISIDYIKVILQNGSENIAYFNSSYFLGTIVATLVFPKLYKNKNHRILILLPILLYSSYYFYLSEFKLFWVTIFCFGLVGFISSLFYVFIITYIQDKVDNQYYSRVFGYHYLIRNTVIYPSILLYVLLNNFYSFDYSLKIISYTSFFLFFILLIIKYIWKIKKL